MKDDLITKLEHSVRLEQKWSDGVPQIAVGMFLIIAMALSLGGKGNLFVVFIPIIPILIEGLRKRFTYPRVGRAVLRENSSRRPIMIFIVALLLAMGIGFLLVSRQHQSPLAPTTEIAGWVLPLLPIVILITLLYRSWKENNRRILWYGLFIALLGGMIAVFRPHRDVVEYIVLGFGALNLIYGVAALTLFVRRYPVMSDAE